MTTRALGAAAGFGWLKNAVNLGRNNPKAIFGGAALLMVVAVVAMVLAALAMGLVVAIVGEGLGGTIAGMLLMMVVLLAVMGMLSVGYLRLIDAVESGRPARAFDVFAGFGDVAASLRMIGLMVLLTIVQNLLMVALLSVFAAGVIDWYMQAMQASMAGTPDLAMMQLPAGIGLAYLVMILIGMVFFGVQSVGFGQVALRGRGVFGAMGNGFAGAFKNLLPLLVMLLTYFVAIIVVGIAAFLLVMLVGLLANAVGAWVGIVIGVPLYLAFVLMLVVVGFGAMYHLWRDVCGGDDTAAEIQVDALTA